jgi:hypothetical protein
MKPLQYELSTEEQERAAKNFFTRFIMKGGNHLSTHYIAEDDRIDVFYLPEQKKVQITIQLGNYFHIYLRDTANNEKINPESEEHAHWLMMAGIHARDDIHQRGHVYEVRGNQLIYNPNCPYEKSIEGISQ